MPSMVNKHAEADQKLECLGAERVYERGEGDDDQNIEEDFEQRKPKLAWQRALEKALCKA